MENDALLTRGCKVLRAADGVQFGALFLSGFGFGRLFICCLNNHMDLGTLIMIFLSMIAWIVYKFLVSGAMHDIDLYIQSCLAQSNTAEIIRKFKEEKENDK